MSKGVIYCRVSTDEQEANGMSLPYQRESCLKFAETNGLKVPEDFVFLESYSGGFLDRPQLDKVLDLARRGEISFVIFTKRDRVARDQYVFQKIMKDLSDAGVRVYYSEEKLTGDSAMDAFMGSTIVWFASWEREQIKLRTNAGKRQHAKSGRWPFAFIPYGYQKNPKTRELEIFNPETEILKRIVGWYLDDGMTLWAIAHKLTEDGVLPPSMSEKDGRPNQRANRKNLRNSVFHWSATTVQRILTKISIYTGVYQAFQKQYKKTEDGVVCLGERPKEDWVSIAIPPIITEKQAEAVLEKLESNRRFAKKRSVREYMLQGKLRCTCQSENPHFVGYFNNAKELRNYRCNMHKADKVSEDRRCSNHISGLKIEGVVVDTLRELLLDPEYLFELALDRYLEDVQMGGESKRDRYHELYAVILETKEKRLRAEDLFVDGKIGKERFEEIVSRLDEEEARASKEMEKELEVIKSVVLKEDAKRTWKDFMNEESELAEAFFDHASYEDLKELVNIVLDRVVISTEKSEKLVRFVFKLPVTPAFAARYVEDEKIEWTDDQGKTHVVAVIPNAPKFLSLDPTKAPLKYRTVEFLPNNGGNGGDGSNDNESDDPENSHYKAEKRLIRLLREKYRQIYESHHV